MNLDHLNINIVNLDLRSPTMLASGIMGYSVNSFKRIAKGGAGAVVTKSIGLKKREGYANPTIVQTDNGLLNAMGLPNPGIDSYIYEISKCKSALNIPLIVSVYGFSVEEYVLVAQKATKAGADAIELNVSCPNVNDTGYEIGQNLETLTHVIKKVKSAVNKPIIAKLSPNVTDIVEIAEAAVDAGADAITAINTIQAMAIDVETTKPILSNIFGGLSGPAIKPISLRCVYKLFEKINAPIIGCGGITNWIDTMEFLLAGATAIQIGTAIAFKNPQIFNDINRGLIRYMKRKKIQSVEKIVGLSHKK